MPSNWRPCRRRSRRGGGEFLFSNGSGGEVYYGEHYRLQIRLKWRWYNIEQPCGFVLPMYTIRPQMADRLTVNWSRCYGSLPPGTYRLIKDYSMEDTADCYATAVFRIAEKGS